jgi:hypothetical protein
MTHEPEQGAQSHKHVLEARVSTPLINNRELMRLPISLINTVPSDHVNALLLMDLQTK